MGLWPGSTTTDREVLVRGRRAFEHGEDETALEALSRLAAEGCEYADVHYMLGMLQERTGDLDAALESLRQAVRVNPGYIEALLALASLHERRGNFDQSQSYAERASQLSQPTAGGLDPTTRGKLANQQAELADALAAAGERQEAIEEYRRALDRCPTFHDIRYRLAMALREAGLPFQAAREFRRILRAHPGMLESQIQLGLTYYSMGRTPEAVREWEAVLERDPSRDEARMYLRLVRGGESAPAFDVGAKVAGWTTAPLPGTTASPESSPSVSFEPREPDFERELDPTLDADDPDLRAGVLEE
ncbi:MAG: tetratricopeptide repeat protein [Deltaproteobacteria bacterium]|jgi:tetratricopeptide (TPR) repeat protein|nr:tetratricopeptide repeat protein [Deltaproteobacteria bacterium]